MKSPFSSSPSISGIFDSIASIDCDRVFIIADRVVAPYIPNGHKVLEIVGGEEDKNIESAIEIWTFLNANGASRRSLIVNIGGGMISDLGGFAAATFKRGLRFVNVPTTLLAAVDAGIGGKTGINFHGCKNEIGVFASPLHTFICPAFFQSLLDEEWLSGVGELVKTYYIAGEEYRRDFKKWETAGFSRDAAAEVIEKALLFKQSIVDEDPTEQGLRKCLNFGHTVGHALESLMLQKGIPTPHGIAIAHGILVELILSHMKGFLPSRFIYEYVNNILKLHFGRLPFSCDVYPTLMELMHHDKKNRNASEINFTAIVRPGEFVIDTTASDSDVTAALDIYRDLIP